VQFWQKPL